MWFIFHPFSGPFRRKLFFPFPSVPRLISPRFSVPGVLSPRCGRPFLSGGILGRRRPGTWRVVGGLMMFTMLTTVITDYTSSGPPRVRGDDRLMSPQLLVSISARDKRDPLANVLAVVPYGTNASVCCKGCVGQGLAPFCNCCRIGSKTFCGSNIGQRLSLPTNLCGVVC